MYKLLDRSLWPLLTHVPAQSQFGGHSCVYVLCLSRTCVWLLTSDLREGVCVVLVMLGTAAGAGELS